MNKRAQKPSSLADVLEKFFNRSGMNRRMAEQKILDSWRRAVGPGIAEQTQSLRIQNRVLWVRVANSVWMQQLQFMKGMILRKIQEETGIADLADIRFFLGEIDGEGAGKEKEDAKLGETAPPPPEGLTASERERVRRGVSGLSDPEMRKIFEGVFSRGLAMGKTPRAGRKKEEK